MRKKLFALFTALLALTLCMALFAACGGGDETGDGGDQGNEQPASPLAVPTDLAVSAAGVVTWSSVDGAVTYTLKVNETEITNAVSPFDLHVSAADALRSNNAQNSIAVKADAVGEREGSAYSAAVTYTFKTADETAAEDFAAQVAAIDDDHTQNETAIKAAKGAYATLSEGAKALVTEEYDALVTLDNAHFVYLVDQIVTPVSLESGPAIVAAEAYYATLLENDSASVTAAKSTLDTRSATYDAYAEKIRTDFQTYVDAVTIETTSTGNVIDTAAGKIADAETEYQTLNDLEKAAVSALYQQLQSKQATLDTAADAEFAAYEGKVADVETAVEAEASATALESAISAAKNAFNALANYTKTENEVTAIDSAVTSAETTLTSWNDAIEEAESALDTAVSGVDTINNLTSTEAEAALGTLNAAKTAYDAYAGYIKADSGVSELYTELENKISDVDEQITTIANAFASEVSAAIDGAEANLEDYNELVALQEEYEEFGTITQGRAAEAKDDLDEKIDALLAEEATTEQDVRVVASEAATGYLQIVLNSYNLLGEALPSVHTVTATVNNSVVEVVHSTQNNSNANCYKIPFTDVAASDSTPVTIKYKIDSGAEETIVLNGHNSSTSVIYFADSEDGDKGFASMVTNATGAITQPAASDAAYTLYFDVYRAEDVALGAARNDDITLYGAPIAEGIEAAGITTLTELYHAIAIKNPDLIGQELSVKVLAYQLSGTGAAEDGYIYSRINGASVSETLELALTQEDTKTPLAAPGTGCVVRDDGSILYILDLEAQATAINNVMSTSYTQDSVRALLRFYVEVYVGESGSETLEGGFYVNVPESGDTAISADEAKNAIYELLGDDLSSAPAVSLKLYIDVREDSGLTDKFTRSNAAGGDAFRVWDFTGADTVKDFYTFPGEGVVAPEAGGAVGFFRGTEFGGTVIFENAYYVEVELTLADTETAYTMYLYSDGTTAAIYKSLNGDGQTVDTTSLIVALVGDPNQPYIMQAEFENALKTAFSDDDLTLIGSTFSSRLALKETSQYKYSDWTEAEYIYTGASTETAV